MNEHAGPACALSVLIVGVFAVLLHDKDRPPTRPEPHPAVAADRPRSAPTAAGSIRVARRATVEPPRPSAPIGLEPSFASDPPTGRDPDGPPRPPVGPPGVADARGPSARGGPGWPDRPRPTAPGRLHRGRGGRDPGRRRRPGLRLDRRRPSRSGRPTATSSPRLDSPAAPGGRLLRTALSRIGPRRGSGLLRGGAGLRGRRAGR